VIGAGAMKPENYETKPILTLAGVGKTFRSGTEALRGIDLTVASGGFVSLLGPSGCGKSTLLRIIAGLVPPSQGRVHWEGDVRGHVGFVFQEPTLMPWATVWDNAYLPLRLAGRSRSEAAAPIAAILASLGLGGFERAYPRELSGGMRMRVSIARALVKSPRLLLLDEPFAALDELTRFRLNEDLLRLWEEQRWTVVFVTHSVFEAVFLSNRIVVMTPRPGRIVADLPIELPYPREGGLRTAPAYAERCRAVSAVLNEAVA
jgi:NitT/TauT family transport system ATP-binding protein